MPISVDPARLKLIPGTGAGGILIGFGCLDCQVKVFGPATYCQSCSSGNLKPVEFSARGSLFSYTTVRVPPAGWPGPVPYILGEVELPEGPHVLAEIIECRPSDLTIGRAMELTIQAIGGLEADQKRAVYKWRPAISGPPNGMADQ
jgi:hypothetical protein